MAAADLNDGERATGKGKLLEGTAGFGFIASTRWMPDARVHRCDVARVHAVDGPWGV